MAEEKRKHPRVRTNNVISYVCLDGEGNATDQGMGMTVDISQGGALIETSRPIDSKFILLTSVDMNKNVLETKARVVHTRKVGNSKYLTGIQFLGSKEEITKIVKNFILDFHSRKDKLIK